LRPASRPSKLRRPSRVGHYLSFLSEVLTRAEAARKVIIDFSNDMQRVVEALKGFATPPMPGMMGMIRE